MNFSITGVHDELYLVTLVNFPAATTASILDQVKASGAAYACVVRGAGEDYSYSVYEIYGKHVERIIDDVDDSLHLAMGCM